MYPVPVNRSSVSVRTYGKHILFENPDFQKADFQKADFQKADFQKTDFQKTDFQKTDFQNSSSGPCDLDFRLSGDFFHICFHIF
ncbi:MULTISPECIES: pentapeptide repeat-containing protein [Methanosarcina]|uniref:pentapeptide repeat-containing protein n=1 Tax=Methanosarcina TaxID=2207 RepID=UPI0035123CCB